MIHDAKEDQGVVNKYQASTDPISVLLAFIVLRTGIIDNDTFFHTNRINHWEYDNIFIFIYMIYPLVN